MTFEEMELKIQAELMRLLSTMDTKVPHSDKAHPMFKRAVEQYRKDFDGRV